MSLPNLESMLLRRVCPSSRSSTLRLLQEEAEHRERLHKSSSFSISPFPRIDPSSAIRHRRFAFLATTVSYAPLARLLSSPTSNSLFFCQRLETVCSASYQTRTGRSNRQQIFLCVHHVCSSASPSQRLCERISLLWRGAFLCLHSADQLSLSLSLRTRSCTNPSPRPTLRSRRSSRMRRGVNSPAWSSSLPRT